MIQAQVAVEPQQRRLVVGHNGDTLRKFQQEFPEVGVTVPPLDDSESYSVLLKGPRRQVTGVEAFVKVCLEAAQPTHRHAHPTVHSHSHP